MHDFETRRLELLDERFGFEIGRHILDGFRKTRLFYTVNRPCGAVLALVLNYIFKALDLDQTAAPDGISTNCAPFRCRFIHLWRVACRLNGPTRNGCIAVAIAS